MEMKSIEEIKDIKNATIGFAVRKIGDKKNIKYVADVKIQTPERKNLIIKNTSIREVLYYLGEAILNQEDMDAISQYVYEYNKWLLLEGGEDVDLDWPGYMDYGSVFGKKEIHLNNCLGYVKYYYLKDMAEDAHHHIASKRFEEALLKQKAKNREL